MFPHPKKLKRNGPSVNAAAAAAADGIAALEASNTNAGDRIIDDPLLGYIIYIERTPTISEMSNKLTSSILGFLGYKDIMRSRICCKKFRDAARITMVPWADNGWACESRFRVDSKKKYKVAVAMTTALPSFRSTISEENTNFVTERSLITSGQPPLLTALRMIFKLFPNYSGICGVCQYVPRWMGDIPCNSIFHSSKH